MECKLCSRKFSNGKALGGHMRSHFATLPLPPKTPQRQEFSDPLTESTSSIDERESTAEKPKKRFRLADRDAVVDRESESGSTRVRCKRAKGEVTPISGESLMSELEMEEDVALCLIMLSKDAWSGSDELTRLGMSRAVTKVHKCDECDRIFKSSQGLGSHRSNHHKNKINDENEFGIGEVTHDCVICGRIFKSAQALGGHKRSHLLAAKFGASLVGVDDHAAIDLNLPAEIEDGEKFDTAFC